MDRAHASDTHQTENVPAFRDAVHQTAIRGRHDDQISDARVGWVTIWFGARQQPKFERQINDA